MRGSRRVRVAKRYRVQQRRRNFLKTIWYWHWTVVGGKKVQRRQKAQFPMKFRYKERCMGYKCSGYRGRQFRTVSGKHCQAWDA